MKKLLTIIFLLAAFAAGAITLQLEPGLTAPGIADGAKLEAAVLVSTNATATATVKAVYELPVYGTVETVTTNTADYYTLSTNTVIGTNSTLAVTDLYTLSTNPTWKVTDIYTVSTNAGVVATNYYNVATNYFTVWTNSTVTSVLTPRTAITTNNLLDVIGMKAVTNSLISLTASGGYAETNGVNRWLVSPARLLVTGESVTLIFTR